MEEGDGEVGCAFDITTPVIPGEREARGKGTQVVKLYFSHKQNPSWPPTVAAIHFPEAQQDDRRLWKMDGRDKPGHDGFCLREKGDVTTWVPFPRASRSPGMTSVD